VDIVEYQEWTIETAAYPEAGKYTERELNYLVHGLAGEAGELVNKFKKLLRNGTILLDADQAIDLDDEHLGVIFDELGDTLWYMARICEAMGTTINSIAGWNQAKLMERKGKGEIKTHS